MKSSWEGILASIFHRCWWILGGKLGGKTTQYRSKNEVKMGSHLGIDFSSILVDFGTQVGKQNRAKIVQKRHRKNDEKTKGNKMAKKSQ